MTDEAVHTITQPTAARGADAGLSPAQREQLERFGQRVNRLGANFAVCGEDGRLLVLSEGGRFRSPPKYLRELALRVTAAKPGPEDSGGPCPDGRDRPGGTSARTPASVLRFCGFTTVLASPLDLAVRDQARCKGRGVALIDLGDAVAQAGGGTGGGTADWPARRIYLSEMLACLVEGLQSLAKAERQMDLVGVELAQVYEELVLLHTLSTHMDLTESDGTFLQRVCDNLT